MSNRAYSPLGKVLDAYARERDVRGPGSIAAYIREDTGEGPGRAAWGHILYGDSTPSVQTVRLFAQAFELTGDQRVRLAWVYVYGEEPPKGV